MKVQLPMTRPEIRVIERALRSASTDDKAKIWIAPNRRVLRDPGPHFMFTLTREMVQVLEHSSLSLVDANEILKDVATRMRLDWQPGAPLHGHLSDPLVERAFAEQWRAALDQLSVMLRTLRRARFVLAGQALVTASHLRNSGRRTPARDASRSEIAQVGSSAAC